MAKIRPHTPNLIEIDGVQAQTIEGQIIDRETSFSFPNLRFSSVLQTFTSLLTRIISKW